MGLGTIATDRYQTQLAEFGQRTDQVENHTGLPGVVEVQAVLDQDVDQILRHQPTDMEVELLRELEFTPLCSPTLLNRLDGISTPEALLQTTLLHLTDFNDWEAWLNLAGLPANAGQKGIRFSDMYLVYAAAMRSQGIAMGDEFICHQAMEEGLLVRPFDLAIRSPRSYYLVVPPEKAGNPAAAAFRDWLLSEIPDD